MCRGTVQQESGRGSRCAKDGRTDAALPAVLLLRHNLQLFQVISFANVAVVSLNEKSLG